MDNLRICPMCGVDPIAEEHTDEEMCNSCAATLDQEFPELSVLDFSKEVGGSFYQYEDVITETDDGFDQDGHTEIGGNTGC